MSEELPHSVSTATIRIFGVDLIVHHLSNGQRIIEANSMAELFEVMASPVRPEVGDVQALMALLRPPPD